MRSQINRHAGYSLLMTLGVVAVCAIMLASLIEYSSSEIVQARRQSDSQKAFLIAEAGLEAAKAAVISTNGLITAKDSFGKYYLYDIPATTLDEKNGPNKFNFFSALSTMTSHSISYNGFTVTFPSNVAFQGGTYDVAVEAKRGHSDDMANLYAIGDLKLVAVGSYNGTTRTIRETVRFKQIASRIFDYAYFINNLGWMYGNTISIDGDVRSNGDFNYKYTPKVNGYTIAAKANSTSGVVTGKSAADLLASYYTSKSDRSRPGNPADPTKPTTSKYSSGYDGVAYLSPDSAHRENQDPLTMPYIGTVDAHEQLAVDKGGYIEYWDSVLNKYTRLEKEFGDDEVTVGTVSKGTYAKYLSPAGDKGRALYISGDASHPIKLHGPFVVQGDLVIKGVYTGQGTIVAKRNVHIIGNLIANDPPIIPPTDPTPYVTYAANRNKDMIGLVARGNVIFGNYTGKPDLLGYATPPFTGKYEVDPRDADNGYVTSKSATASFFNGDYSEIDKNFDGSSGTKSDGTPRRYYQSTFPDADLKGIFVDRSAMTRVDGVMYCNHLIGGSVGDITFNGTVIGRDEAIIFMGHAKFRYDERIHSSHGENVLDIFLPKDLSLPIRLTWREGN